MQTQSGKTSFTKTKRIFSSTRASPNRLKSFVHSCKVRRHGVRDGQHFPAAFIRTPAGARKMPDRTDQGFGFQSQIIVLFHDRCRRFFRNVTAPAICATAFGLGVFSTDVARAQETPPAKTDTPAAAESENQQHGEAKHAPNRLAGETSPYLLKHSRNPVQWQPWDEQALKQAVDENKAIFLSIGYSSCHWCHVMERETFMDEEIAKFMNEHFVCIKVDREERPDIDTIYMTSLNIYNQLTTGRAGGGWPLSMFLTPDGRPFFGGTYFPARDGDREGQAGFLTIATKVSEAWNGSRDRVNVDADKLTEFTRIELDGKRAGDGGEIKASWTASGLQELEDRFDSQYGGFGYSSQNPNTPKFPEPSNLFLLLDLCESDGGNESALNMLRTTLDKMHQGGIYDHLGGGFHRYSVDRFWRIPHFEKMLYDNGQLLTVYSRAWKLGERPGYREVVAETIEFIKREMTDETGGFYAALDAESEGVEGKYNRWEKTELESSLDKESFELFSKVYGVAGPPNFEGEYYVPQLNRPIADWAKQLNMTEEALSASLTNSRALLRTVRDKRIRPLTDLKVLTSWNGMMIRGLADAGRLFEEPEYTEMAIRAADFVWNNLRVDGRLQRTSTGGQVSLNGYLDDYSCFIDGLIAVHEATGESRWLEQADTLQQMQDKLFWDEEHASYFFTSSDHESLLARACDATDGAVPAGSSVSAQNLLYLADKLEKPELRDRAAALIRGHSGLIESFSIAAPRLLISARKLVE